MARPKKNNLDYFSHDNRMRNDRKIKALRAKFGLTGYAVFNMLLEILCESELLIIKWNNDEIELISGDINIVSGELIEITEYLIKIGLLQRVNEWLFCSQLDKRSGGIFDKRTENLDSLRKINGINLTEMTVSGIKSTQSKVKESKVKKTKVFIPPTIDEVKQYFNENGYKEETALKMFKSYDVADWYDSRGNKISNWKQKAINNWFRDENKINLTKHVF